MKRLIMIGLLVCSSISYSTKDKLSEYVKGTRVPVNILYGVMNVESHDKDVIGDNHLDNKAYGRFQMRQPAIDTVNKVYGINKIVRAEDLLNNQEMQIVYAVLYLDYLINLFDDEEKGVIAYNLGLGNVIKGRTNNYYDKVLTYF